MSVLPNATFISPGNSFYGNGNNAYPPVINASTINAQVGNISTVNTTSINLDGQILTADVNDLLLNGVPIATLSNISSIADWSYYAAVSTVRMNNNDLSNVNNVYFQTASSNPSLLLQGNALGTVLSINGQPLTSGNAGNAANWSQYPMQQNLNAAGYDLTAVKAISATNNITGGQLNIFPSGSSSALNLTTDVTGTVLYVDGQPVATGSAGQVSQWSQFPASSAVNSAGFDINNTREINTSSINTSTVNISGNGSLTTDSNAILLYNGSPVALQTGISSIADWYLYPALSSVQVLSGQKVYSLGELNVVGATLNLETSAQLNASTNSVLIADTGVRITGDAGIYLGANGGVQIGGLGGVSISAIGGVAVSAGALFTVNVAGIVSLIAGGAINLAAIGAASLAATGPVNIGSLAYTSLETIRIDNSLITRDTSTSDRLRIRDVQEIQGNNTGGGGSGRLDIIGNGVSINMTTTAGISINAENVESSVGIPLRIRADGTTGSGVGTQFYTLEQQFNPSSQTFLYNSATTNLTGLFPPITFLRNCENVNALTQSTLTHTMSETYDGSNTITYANSLGNVNIQGITNLTAGTINTTTLNLQNLSLSSLQVSSIVGNVGSFNTLLTNASTIRLGTQPGVGVALGRNSIGVGYLSQPVGSNSVAIGYNAGNEAGSYSVNIGSEAGTISGNYNVSLGYRANFLGGNSNVVINATSTALPASANSATYIKPLRNVSTQPAATAFAMGYTSATGELTVANTKINEIESTIQNTSQIIYDGGLLTTTIDGLLTVNGGATFTQNVNMDTTLNVLQGITASTITTNVLNYTTLNPPLPSAQVLSQSGNNVNLSGGGGSVNIATTTQVATNTTKLTNVSYAGGNTTILGDLYTANQFVSGAINAGTNLITAGSLNLSQEANISSLKLYGIPKGVAPSALFYNSTTTQVSYAPITTIVAQPAFVYYVATNGRAGGSGSITDPFSTINEALTKPAATGGGRPGMTIFIAPGAYTEDVIVNISATLPAVSFIGMSDDDSSSKRVQITGFFTINGTDATFTNTIDTVVLNNILVNARYATTSAVTITGAGIRVYLKNGLYTNSNVATVPLIALSSTGVLPTTVAQLVIDDCSITMDSATASGHLINVASGQIFSIGYSDLTHKGTGLAVNMAGGTFGSANQTSFNSKGSVFNIVCSATNLLNMTNCLVSGFASTTVALITLGTNAYLSMTDSTLQNLDTTTEVNNTSRYIYATSATGNLIASIRNNITNSRSTVTQITPFQSAVPPASQLLYFGNIYSNQTATLTGILPAQGGVNWNAVRQFNTDTYTQQVQVIATSASAIVLTPTARGKTYILTGNTTQAFSTAGFGTADAGFFVNVRNGNGTNGGDITVSGATGNTVIHNQTSTQNGQTIVLYWTGTALVAY